MVEAANSVGYSIYSSPVSILAAQIPGQLASPTTLMVGSSIQISWLAPNSRGSPITSYIVLIGTGDLTTYVADNTNCNGALSTILTAQSCLVPFTSLRAQPFSIAWGQIVYVTVTAVNAYGSSLASPVGGTTQILRVPDSPINLANVPATTTGTQIGLTWSPGSSPGGTPVIDFTLAYDQGYGLGTFITFASGITATSYTAIGLTTGYTYQFKTLARNSIGQSEYSSTVSILAAQIPDQPVVPSTVVSGPNVTISWTAPATGGSPITGYIVFIQTAGPSSTFQTDTVYCDGSRTAIRTATSCSVPTLSLRS